MLSLGYPKNKVNFLKLALITPYSEIRKLKEKTMIEKAFLYRSGFTDDKEGRFKDFDFSLKMDKSVGIYKGIRPANFPEKRLKAISGLLAKTTKSGKTTKNGIVNFFLQKIEFEVGSKIPENFLKA